MVDGNAKNSVRSRIDALVGAQEARDGVRVNSVPREENVEAVVQRKVTTPAKVVRPKVAEKIEKVEKVEKKEPNSKRRLFVILASVFGVIVIGLVVTIVVLRPWEKSDGYQENIETANDAALWCEQMNRKYIDTDSYSLGDMYKEFEEKINSGDTASRIFTTICYAKFVYKNGGEASDAVEIMNKVEPLLSDNSSNSEKLDYYTVLKQFYLDEKDSDKVKYYEQLIQEMTTPANVNEFGIPIMDDEDDNGAEINEKNE